MKKEPEQPKCEECYHGVKGFNCNCPCHKPKEKSEDQQMAELIKGKFFTKPEVCFCFLEQLKDGEHTYYGCPQYKGLQPQVEDWDYSTKQATQVMRDKCDWLYNAGMQNNGEYLPKAKDFIEETTKMLLQKQKERLTSKWGVESHIADKIWVEAKRETISSALKEIHKMLNVIPPQVEMFSDCPKCGQETNRVFVEVKCKEIRNQALEQVSNYLRRLL